MGWREQLQSLTEPARRADAAVALARELGAQRLLVYVRDPALALLLPAAGMTKTMAGGPRWREFLRACLREPRPHATVDLPVGQDVAAQALCHDGAAIILLGGQPDANALDALWRDLPLLAATLRAQQSLEVERAEAADAREAAARAHALAKALDAARAASAELNLQLRLEHERKDEFLAMLAHELRNPLSPLLHSIEILRRGNGSQENPMARQLQVMARQLQQLTRLVDDLLDVSRVSRGVIELRRERVSVDEVLDRAVEATGPLLEARQHTLHRSSSGGGVWVNGDLVRLTQVFSNLLGNAAKYTEPGGSISLSVVPDQRRVSVVIQDTGVGIPQDMLARVFDMFTQVPRSLDRAQGGLGIGLTLVRRLVELHGGRVSAYSRGVRQGSTFTVSLPQVASARSQERPLVLLDEAPAVGAGVAGTEDQRPRVLVVDDNHDAADALAQLLDHMGAQTRVVHDGVGALQEVALFAPDLVLLDIGLPGMDGYETARRLRELPGKTPRLVALTGYGSPQDRARALAAGFDDHLVKPLATDSAQRLLDDISAMHAGS